MSTITTERLTEILSETQAVISECNSRSVHGSVEVNARLFENVLMELLRHRAAMQGKADGTLTNEGTMPVNTACKDAPYHIWLQTAGVWPENGEFSELTWCSDNQHQDDTLYVRADVVSGNSPVIPDGWVMVPVEPTADMYDAGDRQLATKQVWDAMIAAAPQQEVKP